MKWSPITLGGMALALLFAQASAARAEFIPWMYAWSNSPMIHSDAPGASVVNLSSQPLTPAVGDSAVVAANLQVVSTAPVAHPDLFTNAGYTLNLYLFDSTAKVGDTLHFTGELNGSVSSGGADLQNTFTGQTTQTVVLGDHLFTASVGSFVSPGTPGSSTSGAIGGQVTITIQSLPEPGTLALSGLGLILLGVARWRAGQRHAAREQESS